MANWLTFIRKYCFVKWICCLLVALSTLLCLYSAAQKKPALISGKVVNESGQAVPGVSVIILGQQKGLATSDSGTFAVKVPAGRAFALLFSSSGYKTLQQNFFLSEGEEEKVTIRLEEGASATMETIVIKQQQDRTEAGSLTLNPKSVINLPTPVMNVENLIKVFVGANNELTSQYNVRGGSYDENLIYVNDFEVFRPYLVRNGQQEGLSFINPEMVRNISFYNGGFNAKYGDKMSSVLDIQYNTPKTFGGSAYISILEQGFHIEGTDRNKHFTYVAGIRNRSNRNLLQRQETQGAYVPASSDLQALLTYKAGDKWTTELLGNLSASKFTLLPQYSQLTSSVFSPLFTSNLAVNINFNGREEDRYSTAMLGLSATYQASKTTKLKFLASRFQNNEAENMDITGRYIFGERDIDQNSPTFGSIINPLGAGMYQNYARNSLRITNYNFSHKGSSVRGKNLLQWGIGLDKTRINDRLNEWELQDSAGYSLPYRPSPLQLSKVIKSSADLDINKISGYLQDNIVFTKGSASYTLQAGIRANYNSLNGETIVAPRLGTSWKPAWGRDIIFRAAAGAYHQPPFYRELRRYDGTLNTDLKAQKSWQGVAGLDYNFIGLGGRPLRFTTEAYYKAMTAVVPYDIDNVRLRYFGENGARAYAAGLEMRLFGELVKDAESWVSLNVSKTREDLANDVYYLYKNAAGEIIDADTKDRVPVSSVLAEKGWVRRPTDRLVTFGMFFQDYLSTNKNFKVYLNTLYGSNLPYNIPGNIKYRNGLTIPPYIRVDIGFSALLLTTEKASRRSHSPFRNFDNIWASFEVFNLIDRDNTISYLLIKDYANNTFTLPNRLTPRLINLKLAARW